jgi:hypothetical protein
MKVVRAIATVSRQLHGQTKMENLFKWNATQLHYLVVEPDLIADHEVPFGWGLLVREGSRLDLRTRPEFKAIPDEACLVMSVPLRGAGKPSKPMAKPAAFSMLPKGLIGKTSIIKRSPTDNP